MIAQIQAPNFVQWLVSQAPHTPLVLDVREPWELSLASVKPLANAPSFDLLPMPMGSVAQRWHELPKDRPIACLCHHGRRSQQIAQYLAEQGFENLFNIAGGIDAWSRFLDTSVATY